MLPTGFWKTPCGATMIWVKPVFGCAAVWVKNCSGVATEQVGTSFVQVPACQPISGDSGAWPSMMFTARAAGAVQANTSARTAVASPRIPDLLFITALLGRLFP